MKEWGKGGAATRRGNTAPDDSVVEVGVEQRPRIIMVTMLDKRETSAAARRSRV